MFSMSYVQKHFCHGRGRGFEPRRPRQIPNRARHLEPRLLLYAACMGAEGFDCPSLPQQVLEREALPSRCSSATDSWQISSVIRLFACRSSSWAVLRSTPCWRSSIEKPQAQRVSESVSAISTAPGELSNSPGRSLHRARVSGRCDRCGRRRRDKEPARPRGRAQRQKHE